MVQLGRGLFANLTDEDEVIAAMQRAVFVIAGFGATMDALADLFGVVAELNAHAVIEHVQAALPQAVITKFFAVLHDTAVYLVHVFEAAVFHEWRQNLAADTARAVGDNLFVLQMVV